MNGRAPNDPATGSQVDVTRNRHPKAAIAVRDSHASEHTRPAARSRTIQTAPLTRPAKIRSPDRPRPSADGRTSSASLSAASALGLDAGDIATSPAYSAARSGLPEKVICLILASICFTTGAGNGAYRSADGYFCPSWIAHHR